MQPRYITQAGTGTSNWFSLNTHISPMNIGLGLIFGAAGATASVQYTYEDISGVYPNPNSATQTPFNVIGTTGANTTGLITWPAAALRLNVANGSGTVTLVIVEAGIVGN